MWRGCEPGLLFCAQGGDGVDGCGALRGDDAGEESADAEGEDREGEDERVPSLDLVELIGNQAGAADGDGDADSESDEDLHEGSAEDEADDVAAICAESHADADLAGAALDGVSGDSIETDSGEDEGKEAEEAGHLCDGALLIEVGVDLLLQGLDVEQNEIRIDVGEDAAKLQFEAFHAVAAQLEHHSLDEVRLVVDALHHRTVIATVLGQRHEEQGTGWFAVGEVPAISRVADDADDFEGRAVTGQVEAKMCADRVFARLEERMHKSFVDDGDVAGRGR